MAHLLREARFETIVVGVVVVEDRGNLSDVWVEYRGCARLGKGQVPVRVADGLHRVRFVCAKRLMDAPRSDEAEIHAQIVTEVLFHVKVPFQQVAAAWIWLN